MNRRRESIIASSGWNESKSKGTAADDAGCRANDHACIDGLSCASDPKGKLVCFNTNLDEDEGRVVFAGRAVVVRQRTAGASGDEPERSEKKRSVLHEPR